MVRDLANLGELDRLRSKVFEQSIFPGMETCSRLRVLGPRLLQIVGLIFRLPPSYISNGPGDIRSQFLITAGQVKV
ncbi:MAG: hypothetical protein CMM07_20810 [Rhodopirellula sp.]|nr:hypothetical protein [Rhodopirellula sp.]